MKKIVYFFLLISSIGYSQPSRLVVGALPADFSFSGNKTAALEGNLVLIKFSSQPDSLNLKKVMNDLGMTDSLSYPGKRNETSLLRWFKLKSRLTPRLITLIKFRLRPTVEWITPVFRQPALTGGEGILAVVPNSLMIETANPFNQPQLQLFTQFNMIEDTLKSRYLAGYHYFTIPDSIPGSVFKLADSLKTSTVFSPSDSLSVVFETLPYLYPGQANPNDRRFSSQLNMTKIKLDKVWNRFPGSASIIIAIIDTGCDLTSNDLNFTARPRGVRTCYLNQEGDVTNRDYHGTGVAGLAAAITNNRFQVAGVAGGCKILPIALCSWTNAEVTIGIEYARQHGARVVNMSFNTGNWDERPIMRALRNAYAQNMVLVSSAGNCRIENNCGLIFPAIVPFVIAVGGSDLADAPDNGTVFGDRDYGYGLTGLSVVAPSTRSPALGSSITSEIDGSSASAALVSGEAALILSNTPQMRNVRVREIIETTADKVVNAASYATVAGFNNGGRNVRMGYGRINLERGLGVKVAVRSLAVATFQEEDGTTRWWIVLVIIAVIIVVAVVVVKTRK